MKRTPKLKQPFKTLKFKHLNRNSTFSKSHVSNKILVYYPNKPYQ